MCVRLRDCRSVDGEALVIDYISLAAAGINVFIFVTKEDLSVRISLIAIRARERDEK